MLESYKEIFKYDDLDRLTNADGNNYTAEYRYNAIGNLQYLRQNAFWPVFDKRAVLKTS